MARILIVGKGGFGDMFPLFATAAALRAKGHSVSIAAEGHHAAACESLGITLTQLANDKLAPNESGTSIIHAALQSLSELRATLSPDSLAAEVEELMPVAAQADLIIGNQLAYSGSIVRKKLAKPWVFCVASPLAIPSYRDPPLFPYVHKLQALTTALSLTQTPYIDAARAATRVLMWQHVRLQKRLGIKDTSHPRFEGMYSEDLNLLATSPVLITPQSDWPANTILTGFTWFEPSFLGDEDQARSLSDFMAAGPPPVVFAPGGSKRIRPGRFFDESIKACQMLGIRAVMIAAKRFHSGFRPSPNILVTGYFPYSKMFKQARAVVHSGGIGTLGWSLRLGLPSLLVPSDWDQHDNARRALARNLAMVLPNEDYKAPRIASTLNELLENHNLRELLQHQAALVASEDGAVTACGAVESLLAKRGIQ